MISAAVAAIVFVVAGTLLLLSPGSHAPSGPRKLTLPQAGLLARFRQVDLDDGGIAFIAHTGVGANTVSLTGYVDFSSAVGYAALTGAGENGVVEWNAATLLVWLGGDGTTVPQQVPDSEPATTTLDPATSPVDTLLGVLLALGSPDSTDPAALVKGGSRFIRADTVDGHRVAVIDGPPGGGTKGGPATDPQYWVDVSGQLRRFELTLAGGSSPAIVDLDPAAFHPIPIAAALGG